MKIKEPTKGLPGLSSILAEGAVTDILTCVIYTLHKSKSESKESDCVKAQHTTTCKHVGLVSYEVSPFGKHKSRCLDVGNSKKCHCISKVVKVLPTENDKVTCVI